MLFFFVHNALMLEEHVILEGYRTQSGEYSTAIKVMRI
jgi:hypothetical protein